MRKQDMRGLSYGSRHLLHTVRRFGLVFPVKQPLTSLMWDEEARGTPPSLDSKSACHPLQ
jgi:hypothetical protein